MSYLGNARSFKSVVPVSLSLLRPRPSLRSLHFSYSSTTSTNWPPLRRMFSIKAHLPDDLFDYTSGKWIVNNDIRHAERRRVFNVDALCRLAAESVNRCSDDIVDLKKLDEDRFGRNFLITMHCGFKMVARIPYPISAPKYFAVASEVATMAFLRSSGLPIPEIYGYSPVSDNAAETEYVFMEFIEGINLDKIWIDLEDGDIISVLRQLAELELKMMSMVFPAGGSLYYAKDLEKVAAGRAQGISLEDKRFCIGPETKLSLWRGRRSQLDVDRGPYKSVDEALTAGAKKELAYLEQFGRPLFPFNRLRMEAYQYQEQLPSDHIENLSRYLLIASSLIPGNPALGLSHFCIRHPDIRLGNIIVSRSSDSDLRVVGLTNWQHTSILPQFLLAGVPRELQDYGDPITKMQPVPPQTFDGDRLNEIHQYQWEDVNRHRLLYYHYFKNTEQYNMLHYTALMDPVNWLRRHLFYYASNPWDGEPFELKYALIQAMEKWETLTGPGGPPCPLVFDSEDVSKTVKLEEDHADVDLFLELLSSVGVDSEGWAPIEWYEEAIPLIKQLKEDTLANISADEPEELANTIAHWPFDDMDETKYA